jgi:hypothetical protein
VRLYSYVVRYDSGFAPNPFYGFCTLATCKPDIRRSAQVGHWIVGTGSADKRVKRGGHLVYAMRVTETLTHRQYWDDPRFRKKRPSLRGSSKHACGDNIYRWDTTDKRWRQLDSFHSNADGSPKLEHIRRDTGVDRVLISNHFIYFGGRGPEIPQRFRNHNGLDICKTGVGHKTITDGTLVQKFLEWVESKAHIKYVDSPTDWVKAR